MQYHEVLTVKVCFYPWISWEKAKLAKKTKNILNTRVTLLKNMLEND